MWILYPMDSRIQQQKHNHFSTLSQQGGWKYWRILQVFLSGCKENRMAIQFRGVTLQKWTWITKLLSDKSRFSIQAALLICGLFICEFAYSHWQKMVQNDNTQIKNGFFSANSRFVVQNDGTYLPRISREPCISMGFSSIAYQN